MSGSINATLNAGIGGPPPRPYATATLTTPCQNIDFEITAQAFLGGGYGPGFGGETSIYIGTEPYTGSPDFEFSFLTILFGSFYEYEAASGTVTTNGGTLITPVGSDSWTQTIGTASGTAIPFELSGSVTATEITNPTTVDGTLTGTISGNITVTTPSGTCVFLDVGLGTATSLNVIQALGVSQDIAYLQISFLATGGEAVEGITLAPLLPFRESNLALSGANTEILASAMDYTVDWNGDITSTANTWVAATDFVEGYEWSATGPLAVAGTHTVTMRDHTNSGVVSNTQTYFLPFVQLEAIYALPNVPAPLNGLDFESPLATGLEYQLNGAGNWIAVGYFEPTGTSGEGTWTGVGPAEPPGNYTLQVRNTAIPDHVSNVVPYQVTQPGPLTADLDLPVWSIAPDWANGVLERLEWLTDSMQSAVGAEQRLQLRLTPRRTFEYDFLIFGADRAWYDFAMKAYGTADWLVPVWHDLARLTNAISPSDAVVAVATAGHEYFEGGYLVFWASTFSYEVATIASVSSNAVTLTTGTAATWPIGTAFMPIIRAALAEEPEATRKADRALQVTMGWMGKTANSFPASTGGADTYNGFPVLTLPPDETDDLKYKFDRIKFDIDPKIGLRETVDTAGYGFGTQQYAWFVNGYSANYSLRSFLYALGGMLNPCWLPTFYEDLVLTKNIYISDTSIQVALCGYTEFEGPSLKGRQNICIQPFTGPNVYAEVTGSSVDGSNEILELSGIVGTSLPMSAVMRISFMALARQQTDQVEIQHEAAGGVCTISTIFREAPQSRVQYFQVLDPTKTNVGELSNAGATYTMYGTEPTDGLALSVGGQTSLKYFLECYFTQPPQVANNGFGLCLGDTTLANIYDSCTGVCMLVLGSSASVYNNGEQIAGGEPAWTVTPYYIGLLVDLDANLLWFCQQPGGPYNFSTTANPTEGTGGYDISWRGDQPLYFFAMLKNYKGTGAEAQVFAGNGPSAIQVDQFYSGWPIDAPAEIQT